MENFTDDMLDSFREAITRYSESVMEKYQHKAEDPWVLFVVEEKERNVIDQKIIETELQFKFGIKSMRMTFAEIKEVAQFNNDNHILKIRGKEIGFVYYRVGY